MKRRTLVTACVCLIGLAGRSTQAANEVSARVGTSVLIDDGAFAFSQSKRLPQLELGYARRLLQRGWALWAESSWSLSGSRSAPLFGALRARAVLQSWSLGLRVERPLVAWLVPHLRSGAGLILGLLSLEQQVAMADSASDVAPGVSGYLLGGVTLLMPRRWMPRGRGRLSGGVVLEGGVNLTTPLSFDLAPTQDPDLRSVPLSGVEFGSMPMTAALLRIGGVLRF